jgi:crotonobetainyl-CoA:carnitine CoA-transferase CaiB-like acyl-CoA transferase
LLMTEDSGEPAGYGYSYADMTGGYTGALAALNALRNRRRTGRGQYVDLSQFEAAISVLGPALLDIAVNGRDQAPPGYLSQERPAAPHGVYRCRPLGDDDDRWLAISVRNQGEWDRFVGAMGSPAWSYLSKFRTLYSRIRNSVELDANVSRWTIEQSAEDTMERLQRVGIAAGVVCNGADICERNPQLQARRFWGAVKLPDGTSANVTGIPAKMTATPGSIRSPSPLIGSSNDYVLGELLGYSAAECDALINEKAIWP